jgi:hypothetical protein
LSALPSRNGHYPSSRGGSTWMWRSSAGLLAAVLGVTATLTASASALPGEPLYNLKQAQEELSVRLAPDDQARALALLGRADARLDETARLLLQGRTTAALETTQRYGQNVERATSTYLITIDETSDPGLGPLSLETRLTQQQEQLQTILQSAPEPARAELREALVTTERGRALVADPRPVERALGRASADKSAVAAAVPTTAAEDSPTVVPTRRPAGVPQPPAPVVVAQATAEHAPETLVAQHEGTNRGGDSGARPQNSAPNGVGKVQQPAKAAVTQDRDADDGPSSPPVVARDEGGSNSDRGGDGGDRSGPTTARGGTGSAPAQSERPVVTQRNSAGTTANASANGNGNEADAGHGRGDEAPQQPAVAQGRGDDAPQPAVARQPAVSVTGRDSGGAAASDNKPASGGTATGGTAREANAKDGNGNANNANANSATVARTTPPQVASPSDKANVSGRDSGDSRQTAPAAPAARPQPTPTPATTRRSGEGGDSNPHPTPVPARNSPPDTRGGGGNDTGQPGD